LFEIFIIKQHYPFSTTGGGMVQNGRINDEFGTIYKLVIKLVITYVFYTFIFVTYLLPIFIYMYIKIYVMTSMTSMTSIKVNCRKLFF